jgi:glycolate oxidase FAD binding subunit
MSGPEDGKRFIIDGKEPREVVFPTSIEQVSEALRSAGERKLAVAPVGLGAFLHLGGSPRRYDMALCLEQLNNIADYQPTDMTITVEAGMSLSQLQAVLGENGQWLPLDPPNPEQVTVGGLIAANLNGPSRLSQGTIRDFLIGLKVVRPDGSVVKGGGRVVKNVAGYDLAKLYCGSLGTLGVIVEATFMIRPRPEDQAVLMLRFPSVDTAMQVALEKVYAELQPFFLELTNFDPLQKSTGGFWLFVGLAGIPEDVDYQRQRLRMLENDTDSSIEEITGEAVQNLAVALRDFPVTGEAGLRCKTSLLPDQVAEFCTRVEEEVGLRGMSVQLQARAGNGIVYSRFIRPDDMPPGKLLSLLDWLRIQTKRMNGYTVVEEVEPSLKDRVDVWGHVGATFPLMKKLKETFDPNELLNPGRFVGGL